MGIKLSISNIAWAKDNYKVVYNYLNTKGFSGIEIAPTKIFSTNPYDKLEDAECYSLHMKDKYGLSISSIQSIWYGRNERLFGSLEDRELLLDYTKKAINFAERIGAKNLVFGCPKNRNISTMEDKKIAVNFFRELGDYALAHGTVLALEANPQIYGTNFINTTKEAVELINEVDSKGFMLNLDFGTMIYNEEDVETINSFVDKINHVHISEPYLNPIKKREQHKSLFNILEKNKFEGYVSIEMSMQDDVDTLLKTIDYIKNTSEEK